SLIRESASENAFLTLNGEPTQDLPLMRQTLNRGEFYGVVGVVIQLRKVGDHEIKPSVFCCIGGLKTIESHRLVCDRIHDRAAGERGGGDVVRILKRSVRESKHVLFRSIV